MLLALIIALVLSVGLYFAIFPPWTDVEIVGLDVNDALKKIQKDFFTKKVVILKTGLGQFIQNEPNTLYLGINNGKVATIYRGNTVETHEHGGIVKVVDDIKQSV